MGWLPVRGAHPIWSRNHHPPDRLGPRGTRRRSRRPWRTTTSLRSEGPRRESAPAAGGSSWIVWWQPRPWPCRSARRVPLAPRAPLARNRQSVFRAASTSPARMRVAEKASLSSPASRACCEKARAERVSSNVALSSSRSAPSHSWLSFLSSRLSRPIHIRDCFALAAPTPATPALRFSGPGGQFLLRWMSLGGRILWRSWQPKKRNRTTRSRNKAKQRRSPRRLRSRTA